MAPRRAAAMAKGESSSPPSSSTATSRPRGTATAAAAAGRHFSKRSVKREQQEDEDEEEQDDGGSSNVIANGRRTSSRRAGRSSPSTSTSTMPVATARLSTNTSSARTHNRKRVREEDSTDVADNLGGEYSSTMSSPVPKKEEQDRDENDYDDETAEPESKRRRTIDALKEHLQPPTPPKSRPPSTSTSTSTSTSIARASTRPGRNTRARRLAEHSEEVVVPDSDTASAYTVKDEHADDKTLHPYAEKTGLRNIKRETSPQPHASTHEQNDAPRPSRTSRKRAARAAAAAATSTVKVEHENKSEREPNGYGGPSAADSTDMYDRKPNIDTVEGPSLGRSATKTEDVKPDISIVSVASSTPQVSPPMRTNNRRGKGKSAAGGSATNKAEKAHKREPSEDGIVDSVSSKAAVATAPAFPKRDKGKGRAISPDPQQQNGVEHHNHEAIHAELRAELEKAKQELRAANATIESHKATFDKITDLYTCNICLEMLRNPLALSCGHVFCQNDLWNWFHRTEDDESDSSDGVDLSEMDDDDDDTDDSDDDDDSSVEGQPREITNFYMAARHGARTQAERDAAAAARVSHHRPQPLRPRTALDRDLFPTSDDDNVNTDDELPGNFMDDAVGMTREAVDDHGRRVRQTVVAPAHAMNRPGTGTNANTTAAASNARLALPAPPAATVRPSTRTSGAWSARSLTGPGGGRVTSTTTWGVSTEPQAGPSSRPVASTAATNAAATNSRPVDVDGVANTHYAAAVASAIAHSRRIPARARPKRSNLVCPHCRMRVTIPPFPVFVVRDVGGIVAARSAGRREGSIEAERDADTIVDPTWGGLFHTTTARAGFAGRFPREQREDDIPVGYYAPRGADRRAERHHEHDVARVVNRTLAAERHAESARLRQERLDQRSVSIGERIAGVPVASTSRAVQPARGRFTIERGRDVLRRGVRDAEDGVRRCVDCNWELENGRCEHCDISYESDSEFDDNADDIQSDLMSMFADRPRSRSGRLLERPSFDSEDEEEALRPDANSLSSRSPPPVRRSTSGEEMDDASDESGEDLVADKSEAADEDDEQSEEGSIGQATRAAERRRKRNKYAYSSEEEIDDEEDDDDDGFLVNDSAAIEVFSDGFIDDDDESAEETDRETRRARREERRQAKAARRLHQTSNRTESDMSSPESEDTSDDENDEDEEPADDSAPTSQTSRQEDEEIEEVESQAIQNERREKQAAAAERRRARETGEAYVPEPGKIRTAAGRPENQAIINGFLSMTNERLAQASTSGARVINGNPPYKKRVIAESDEEEEY